MVFEMVVTDKHVPSNLSFRCMYAGIPDIVTGTTGSAGVKSGILCFWCPRNLELVCFWCQLKMVLSTK